MSWKVSYLPEAKQDLSLLDGSQRKIILKAIRKVQQNPLPDYQGGYGKPLGHHNRSDLTGFLKIKQRKTGIRVVYSLREIEGQMIIIIIGAREDEEVYVLAEDRIRKHQL